MKKIIELALIPTLFTTMILVALPISRVEAAPVYVVKQGDGTLRFTTKEPPPGGDAKVFTAKRGSYAKYSMSRNPYGGRSKLFKKSQFDSIIKGEASKVGVNYHLVKAVIHAESAFNPHARSPKGAIGLMQLMPDTARMLGVGNPWEPSQNIRGGVAYLSMLYDRYKGNLQYALAAYNAGPGAVDNYKGIPPYRETKEYVQRVLRLYKEYQLHG